MKSIKMKVNGRDASGVKVKYRTLDFGYGVYFLYNKSEEWMWPLTEEEYILILTSPTPFLACVARDNQKEQEFYR